MTTELIRMWHCDHLVCSAAAVEGAEGWTDAIYTHGCPSHGAHVRDARRRPTEVVEVALFDLAGGDT